MLDRISLHLRVLAAFLWQEEVGFNGLEARVTLGMFESREVTQLFIYFCAEVKD